MARMKQYPRYNVLSCRVSDETKGCIDHALGNRTIQDYIHEALEEKLIRDRQVRIDIAARSSQ